MKLATWNVNSLKVRLGQLLDWLEREAPDVVALQELKLVDDVFPHAELMAAGYVAVSNGQKTYNGVAILTKLPLVPEAVRHNLAGFADEQRRVIAATVGRVRVVSVYVVNGQTLGSEKFGYKLRFLDALRDTLAREAAEHAELVVMGDYNIVPTPADSHDPAAWEGGIFCSPEERAGLAALQLHDAFAHAPEVQGRFTWWDYRQGALRRDHGLRIDHVMVSAPLLPRVRSWRVDKSTRGLERASDHAPVIVTLG